MFLLVLDRDPILAVQKVPARLKFKQLIELGQLICSAGISSVYKRVQQGKAIQSWILRNPKWVLSYFTCLFEHVKSTCNLKEESVDNLNSIMNSLSDYCKNSKASSKIETAIFRYSKNYSNTRYFTDSELFIDIASEEYRKYVDWKESLMRCSHGV